MKQEHVGIGSINSPMQCMMKGVCAQCLQRHVNPHTGEELFVFSRFNQDQHLDFVDFKNSTTACVPTASRKNCRTCGSTWLSGDDFKRLYGQAG